MSGFNCKAPPTPLRYCTRGPWPIYFHCDVPVLVPMSNSIFPLVSIWHVLALDLTPITLLRNWGIMISHILGIAPTCCAKSSGPCRPRKDLKGPAMTPRAQESPCEHKNRHIYIQVFLDPKILLLLLWVLHCYG